VTIIDFFNPLMLQSLTYAPEGKIVIQNARILIKSKIDLIEGLIEYPLTQRA